MNQLGLGLGLRPRVDLDAEPADFIVDLFAGGGGASEGIRLALGRCPDVAVNHSPAAIAMHEANHPRSRHYCESVYDVDPVEACGGLRPRLLWASPDCFPAGTLVLTSQGYRPIEAVAVGDVVLTHLGRWRRVTATMSSMKRTRVVRGHGHPGLRVSGEHPFLTVTRRDVWSRTLGRPERTFSAPVWTKADDLVPGRHYWATPRAFETLPVPAVGGRGLPFDERLLWLAGRYLADGWTRLTDTRAELVICCGKAKADALRERVSVWPRAGARSDFGELPWHEREARTAIQFSTNHRGLVAWLRDQFGSLAHGKRLPGWVYGLSEAHRRALLDGYLAGDGYLRDGVQECSSVSPALAYGIRSLAASLGYVASVYVSDRVPTTIEGREVETRPSYSVRWRVALDPAHRQHHELDGHIFSQVRGFDDDGAEVEVFNISVEEDESYVVEGVVVHNCTHFSRAKGGKPREKGIRSLAWVVVRWARAVRPATIALENVAEFQTWGPLDDAGQPIPERAGETFRAFVGELCALGYSVDWRVLCAADYGAPTSRRRLFLVARADGVAVRWPEPTHGPGRSLPWRTAAECIDWSIPVPSIFDRARPLAEATQRRIAEGVRRFVLQHPSPFIVGIDHRGSGLSPVWSSDAPLTTVTTEARHAVVAPSLAKLYGTSTVADVTAPMPTVTAGGGRGGGHLGVIAPTLIQTGYGEREGQAPRVLDLRAPLGTIVAGGAKHGLVAAFLAKHYGGPNGNACYGQDLRRPAGTITARDSQAVVTAPLEPVTVAAVERGRRVAAFLTLWYGQGGQHQDVREPLRTIVTKDRFGLVTVELDGEPWAIVDIGMRMLQPRELATAQGFRPDYILTGTKSEQVERIGNSVCPQLAEAIVRENVGDAGARRAA